MVEKKNHNGGLEIFHWKIAFEIVGPFDEKTRVCLIVGLIGRIFNFCRL